MSGLGDLVRHARDRQGWSQGELGVRIGRDGSYISRLETGRMKETPTPEDLRGLARHLGVTVPAMLAAAGYDVDDDCDDDVVLELCQRLAPNLRDLDEDAEVALIGIVQQLAKYARVRRSTAPVSRI